MAKAGEISGLEAEMPAAAAAAAIVEMRARELADHAHNVLDIGDIDRVHDMRVASRRLRAALETFEVCFSKKGYGAALKEVKALADALGERRDRDVTIAALDRFSEGLAAPDRPGIDSLVAALRREQAEANEELAPFVSDERVAELRRRMERLAASARELIEPEPEPEPEPAPEVESVVEGAPIDAAALATESAGNGAGGAGDDGAGEERP